MKKVRTVRLQLETLDERTMPSATPINPNALEVALIDILGPDGLADAIGNTEGVGVETYPYYPDDYGEPELWTPPPLGWHEGDAVAENYGGLTLRQRFIADIDPDNNFGFGRSGWSVHHLVPQWMKGVLGWTQKSLDEMTNLTLISPIIKDEIDNLYMNWTKDRAKELNMPTSGKFWARNVWVRLSEERPEAITDFINSVKTSYAHYMIPPGSTNAYIESILPAADDTRVNRIRAQLEGGGRMGTLLNRTVGGIGLLALFANNAATASAIANDGPEVQAAWQDFALAYRGILLTELQGRRVTGDMGHNLVNKFNDYLIAIQLDETARNAIIYAMRRWVLENLDF